MYTVFSPKSNWIYHVLREQRHILPLEGKGPPSSQLHLAWECIREYVWLWEGTTLHFYLTFCLFTPLTFNHGLAAAEKTAPKRKGDEPAFESPSFLGEPGLFVFRGTFCIEDSSSTTNRTKRMVVTWLDFQGRKHHMCQGLSQLSFCRGLSGPTFNGESLYWVYKPLLWVYKPLPIWICIVGDKLHIFGESLYWVYWVDESIPYYLEKSWELIDPYRPDRPAHILTRKSPSQLLRRSSHLTKSALIRTLLWLFCGRGFGGGSSARDHPRDPEVLIYHNHS